MKGAAAIAALVLAAAQATAAEPEPALEDCRSPLCLVALLQTYVGHSQPGEHHRYLDPLVGRWQAQATFWLGPQAPPAEMTLTFENEWILGGRFLMQSFSGEWSGLAVSGIRIVGYDTHRQHYVATWMSTLSNALYAETGTASESGKVFELRGEFDDPVAAERRTSRSVTRILADGRHTFELFGVAPDGEEFKALHLVSTRR